VRNLWIHKILGPYITFSLDTGAEYVRGRLAQYANDLLSLGVDGLRLDAAKRTLFLYLVTTVFILAVASRCLRR
jgi:hypothetical protein